jgi:hypothetical protein
MLLPWNLRVKSVSWKGVFFKARPILRFSSFELLAVAALCRQHIRYMHMHMHMHMHMCIHAHVHTCTCHMHVHVHVHVHVQQSSPPR